MSDKTTSPSQPSTAYNIFILVLTLLSLAIILVMLLPLSDETIRLLQVYDNLICAIFLVDFFKRLFTSPNKSVYFFRQGGWLDLLGSIPSFGLLFKYSGLLRLARLRRLVRIQRELGGKTREALVKDVIENRDSYAGFITVLMTLLVLTTASVLVLQFESVSPDGNIKTGEDALWYALVTITTVGYGDRFPVTLGGRITAFFIMFMGVGIIGVLASVLSSVLVGSSAASSANSEPGVTPAIEKELTDIRSELAVLRRLLENKTAEGDQLHE
jgi:voltage-gated potassium channel